MKTEFDELESYIMNTFGEMENVFHEVYSPDIHVDIEIIPPNEHDHFYNLKVLPLVEACDKHGEIACCRLSSGKLIRFYQLILYIMKNYK